MCSLGKRQFLMLSVVLLVLTIGLTYVSLRPAVKGSILTPPSATHWFGTDLAGGDVLTLAVQSTWIELATIIGVAGAIYFGGIILGGLVASTGGRLSRELAINLVNYWLTLPILLIAVFIVILIGPGQSKLAVILATVLLPSHAFFAYVRFTESWKKPYVLVKRSLGFSRTQILSTDVIPSTAAGLFSYTLSRLPEILSMDLAFNFLGLGVQPPKPSFGRLLYEGLPFMFSAWWIWALPMTLLLLLVLVLPSMPLSASVGDRND